MADAQRCNDLILLMQSVDGCSEASPISMDPCKVPEGAELRFSNLLTEPDLLFPAPIIGTGALNDELIIPYFVGGLPGLEGKWLSLGALDEEVDASTGGPDTKT